MAVRGVIFDLDGTLVDSRLDFDAMLASSANAPDPDGKLDRKAVRKLSIGLNSAEDVNDLEVGDVYVAW